MQQDQEFANYVESMHDFSILLTPTGNKLSQKRVHSKQHWHGCMIEKQEMSHMFHITLCRTLNIKPQQRDISSLKRTLMTSGSQQNDLKHKRQDFLEHSATPTGKRNKKLQEMTNLL